MSHVNTKIGYIGGKVLSEDCFSRLRMAFLFSDDPKWERIGEAHLSYYASATTGWWRCGRALDL